MAISALILAKGQSKRLPNKNTVDFHGEPMFMVNVKKCLGVFDKVYVSSEDRDILKLASDVGAIPIMRDQTLCGSTPNIPVYQHAMHIMDSDFVAVQANSPTVDIKHIKTAKQLLENYDEIITCHPDHSIYGSVWAIRKSRLVNYRDHYKPQPDVMILDHSIDVHTSDDLQRALISI